MTSSGKSVFDPSNSIALALSKDIIKPQRFLPLGLDDPRLERYLKGETIQVTPEDNVTSKGIVVVGAGAAPLGLGKIDGTQVKNMYPKAWRLI